MISKSILSFEKSSAIGTVVALRGYVERLHMIPRRTAISYGFAAHSASVWSICGLLDAALKASNGVNKHS